MKDTDVPLGTLLVAAVTWIAVRTAGVTVSFAVAVFFPKTALTVAFPTDADVATPSLPEAFEIVATAVFELDHVTASVTSCVRLSLKVPVAANDAVSPFGMLGARGVTASDLRDAEPTVRNALDVAPVAVSVAVMDAAPAATPVARPVVASTVATAVSLDAHVTAPASGCTVPSLNVPVALKTAWLST